jgi:hypothetical protein
MPLALAAALWAAACGGGGSSGGAESGAATDVITITSNATIDSLRANPMKVTLQATGNSAPLVWNVTKGGLPTGLSLDSSTGTISGTPLFDVNQSVLTIVAGEGKAVGTKVFTFNVYEGDTLGPISPPNAHIHAPYSLIVNGSGSTDPKYASIGISAGTLPPGLTFTPGGLTSNYLAMIAGTPTQAGTYAFTVQMKDTSISDLPQTLTASATIIVDTQLAIIKSNLNNPVQGLAFSDAFAAVNGTAPFRWSVSGTLPSGLILDAASGTVSGTTTANPGPISFTVNVADASAPVESDAATGMLTVVAPLRMQAAISFPAYIGQAFFNPVGLSGGTGPYTLSIASGSLPPGLTVDTDGLVGKPKQLGTYNFVLKAIDSGSPQQMATQALTITVTPTPLTSGPPVSPAPINELYHSQIAATGGTPPYSWTVTSGNLPPGLTLNASTGSIDGTPTQNGTFNFVPQISDSSNPVQTLALNDFIEIRKALGRNDSIATATPLGNSAFMSPIVSFSISPYVDPISATTANPDTDFYRLIATGGSTVHVETIAQRSFGNDLLDTVIEILDASGHQLTSCEPGTSSVCMNDDIDGTTLDSALNLKVPGAANVNTTFYVHVLDWRGDARPDMPYYLNITGVIEPLSISPTTLGAGATRGVSYQQQFTTTGGQGANTWALSSGALPPGWTLNTAGLLSGTATTDGTYTFAIKATDSANPPQTATQQYTLPIAEPVVVTSSATWPTACANQPYTFQITATGGVPPLTFGVVLNDPIGFDLDQKTGIFNGLFRTTGTFMGRGGASDSAQPISSQSQNISIPVVNCP